LFFQTPTAPITAPHVVAALACWLSLSLSLSNRAPCLALQPSESAAAAEKHRCCKCAQHHFLTLFNTWVDLVFQNKQSSITEFQNLFVVVGELALGYENQPLDDRMNVFL
jgi:hypothetical protein